MWIRSFIWQIQLVLRILTPQRINRTSGPNSTRKLLSGRFPPEQFRKSLSDYHITSQHPRRTHVQLFKCVVCVITEHDTAVLSVPFLAVYITVSKTINSYLALGQMGTGRITGVETVPVTDLDPYGDLRWTTMSRETHSLTLFCCCTMSDALHFEEN